MLVFCLFEQILYNGLRSHSFIKQYCYAYHSQVTYWHLLDTGRRICLPNVVSCVLQFWFSHFYGLYAFSSRSISFGVSYISLQPRPPFLPRPPAPSLQSRFYLLYLFLCLTLNFTFPILSLLSFSLRFFSFPSWFFLSTLLSFPSFSTFLFNFIFLPSPFPTRSFL